MAQETGDKLAKDRAVQRGDQIMARPDSGYGRQVALPYYNFAESPKAEPLKKLMAEDQKGQAKAADATGKSIKQGTAADKKKFDKKTDDLEKELGL